MASPESTSADWQNYSTNPDEYMERGQEDITTYLDVWQILHALSDIPVEELPLPEVTG